MLLVFLRRMDNNKLVEFRARGFPDILSLARYFTTDEGEAWNAAEVFGHECPYSGAALRSMILSGSSRRTAAN